MTKSNFRSALLGTAALAVGTVGAAEMAQAQLDEIVVTATKRERSLQDIPVSVSAFSAEALELSGVTNIDSLQTSVPGSPFRLRSLQDRIRRSVFGVLAQPGTTSF